MVLTLSLVMSEVAVTTSYVRCATEGLLTLPTSCVKSSGEGGINIVNWLCEKYQGRGY